MELTVLHYHADVHSSYPTVSHSAAVSLVRHRWLLLRPSTSITAQQMEFNTTYKIQPTRCILSLIFDRYRHVIDVHSHCSHSASHSKWTHGIYFCVCISNAIPHMTARIYSHCFGWFECNQRVLSFCSIIKISVGKQFYNSNQHFALIEFANGKITCSWRVFRGTPCSLAMNHKRIFQMYL